MFAAMIVRKGPPITAFVTDMDDPTVAVVCEHDEHEGGWVPKYGVKQATPERPAYKLPLPTCFALDPLAAMALDGTIAQSNGGI